MCVCVSLCLSVCVCVYIYELKNAHICRSLQAPSDLTRCGAPNNMLLLFSFSDRACSWRSGSGRIPGGSVWVPGACQIGWKLRSREALPRNTRPDLQQQYSYLVTPVVTVSCDTEFIPRDTLSTVSCDMVFIPRDTLSTVSCDSVSIPRDTLSTVSCDTVSILRDTLSNVLQLGIHSVW